MKTIAMMIGLMMVGTVLAAPAHADAKKKEAAMEKAAQDIIEDGSNPHLAKLEETSRAIGEKLDKFALAHLYTMREAYGVLEAVRIVRRDVDNAVKACAKDNADLKTDITDRFKSWAVKVDPVVKDKQGAIDAAIKTQTYMKPKEINDYFALIRKTAEHANRAIDKQIITTPEACKGLIRAMDQTEEVVQTLLADISLLPWPPEEGGDSSKAPKNAEN
jgi:hypothetical protein